MLNKVLETNKFVVDNAKYVKINYEKVNELIDELLKFNNVHYLTKVPYDVYSMSTKDIINFLLIYDSIDFSFWGNPKWTINADGKELDGGSGENYPQEIGYHTFIPGFEEGLVGMSIVE